ncbi:MAG: hypothetical protein J7605_06780 [Variovorax sp.]|nr:hypothetical protein [Variovorax sp.]
MVHKRRFLFRDRPVPAKARRRFARMTLRLCLLVLPAISALTTGAVSLPTCNTEAMSTQGGAMLDVGDMRFAFAQTEGRVAMRQVTDGTRKAGQRLAELTITLRVAPGSSALLTPGIPNQRVGQGRIADLEVTIQSRDQVVLSAMAVRPSEVHIAAFEQAPDGRASAESRLGMLEHLYSDIFRQAPTSRFVFSGLPGAARGSGSQALALDAVARARECVLQQLPPGTHLRPLRWDTASLALLHPDRHEGKWVRASVHDGAARPVRGSVTAFARGEHLACEAKTNIEGIASCMLFDVHGHDDEEEDQTTVVTFPGAPRPGSFLLPRTLVKASLSRRH